MEPGTPSTDRSGNGSGSRPAQTGPEQENRGRQARRESVAAAKGAVEERTKTTLEQGKRSAAETVSGTSQALNRAAASFSEQGQSGLAHAASSLSERLSGLAHALESRSAEDLTHDARRVARENPALFIAGGVVLGIALSRFFKASSTRAHSGEDRSHDQSEEDWFEQVSSEQESAGFGEPPSPLSPPSGPVRSSAPTDSGRSP